MLHASFLAVAPLRTRRCWDLREVWRAPLLAKNVFVCGATRHTRQSKHSIFVFAAVVLVVVVGLVLRWVVVRLANNVWSFCRCVRKNYEVRGETAVHGQTA